MDPVPAAPYVVPNSRIPKVVGILNIVFASALMICGLCTIGYYATIPIWTRTMEQLQEKAEADDKAQRTAELDRLAEQEKEAKTDEEKVAIKESRKAVEDRPKAFMPGTMDMKSMGLDAPRLKGFVIGEFATGLVLNLLLLTSGIGLVLRRSWGLTLGLWVSGLKLLRLALVYGYAALVLVPGVADGMAKGATKMMVQQQAAMGKPVPATFDPEILARVYAISLTAYFVGLIVVGSIYPAICLWLLSRPAARAACSRSDKPLAPGETW